MTKNEISMIGTDLLIKAFVYYNRGRFWKYNFDEWLEKELIPVYGNDGSIIDLKREYKSRYGYDTEYVASFRVDDGFTKLLTAAMAKS